MGRKQSDVIKQGELVDLRVTLLCRLQRRKLHGQLRDRFGKIDILQRPFHALGHGDRLFVGRLRHLQRIHSGTYRR